MQVEKDRYVHYLFALLNIAKEGRIYFMGSNRREEQLNPGRKSVMRFVNARILIPVDHSG